MAEQNMIGVAAGLARESFTPFVHTFGVFLTRRVYDQVAMSVAYPNLQVRLLGFLPGLTTPGGSRSSWVSPSELTSTRLRGQRPRRTRRPRPRRSDRDPGRSRARGGTARPDRPRRRCAVAGFSLTPVLSRAATCHVIA